MRATERAQTHSPAARDMALPATLTAIALALAPAVAQLLDEHLDQRQRLLGALAWILTGVALVWRRSAPEITLALVLAISTAASALPDATAPGTWAVEAIALYSVAAQRETRAAMVGCAVTAVVSAATSWVADRSLPNFFTSFILGTGIYVMIAALGRLRRQRTVRRREIAMRLADAELERLLAAQAERQRLARDLHDVAGHHLSAVVVHSSAALRRNDPQFSTEALAVAAENGRKILTELSRLADVISPGPEESGERLETLLESLCGSLVQLGIPVTLEVDGRPLILPPELRGAAYRVVQESLTNAMRYAPGAPVTIHVTYHASSVKLTVHNDRPEADRGIPTLGTGRGVTHMRDRVTAAGGRFQAGPDEAGGWKVHATIPIPVATPAGRLGWAELVNGLLILLCAGLPIVVAVTPPDAVVEGLDVWSTLLLAGFLLARSLPLWWRRRAPWRTLATLLSLDLVWALAWRPGESLLMVLALAWGAEAVAVYSVAAHARPTVPTWLAAPVSGAVGGVLLTWSMLLAEEEPTFTVADAVVLGMIIGGGVLACLLLCFWLWGRTVRKRRARALGWERTALETVAAGAAAAVRTERHRMAAGLGGTVLEHTARLVGGAEAGLADADDGGAALSTVTAEARLALNALRRLLEEMEVET